ncbi:MAG: DUF1707 domain-containing protein [Mycobacteriaceae bacterium]
MSTAGDGREAALPPEEGARAHADALLQTAVGRGRLSLAEYEDRSAQVWRVGTSAELASVTADLTVLTPLPATAMTRRTRARQHTVAVFSENVTTGPVSSPLAATAIFGSAVLDLRRTDLPDEVDVTAVAVFGETKVLVPRGALVNTRGAAVMGDRSVRVDPAQPGAPVINIHATAVMGSVSIGHGADNNEPSGGASLNKDQQTPDRRTEHHRSVQRRAHRRSLWGVLVPVVVVGAAAFGVTQVATADHGTVFGSGSVTVQPGQSSVDVGTLFGSYKVIVPDNARVATTGSMVFGSTECQAACSTTGTGPLITVHATGAFGSVQVITQTEAQQDNNNN